MLEKTVLIDLGLRDHNEDSSSEDEDIFTYKGRQRTSSITSKTSEVFPETSEEKDLKSETSEDERDSKEDQEDLGDLTSTLEGLHVGETKPLNLADQMEKLKIVSEAKDSEIKERKPMMNDFNNMGSDQQFNTFGDSAPWGPNAVGSPNDRSVALLNGGSVSEQTIFSDQDLRFLLGICEYESTIQSPPLYNSLQPSYLTPTPSPNPPQEWLMSPNPSSSGYVSGAVGSPSSSLASRSPMHEQLIPSTISQSSDEEDVRKDAIAEVRAWTYSQEMREVKKDEIIRASNKDSVGELFGVLHHLLCRDRNFTNRKFVRIYTIICQLLQRNGSLKHFFLEENNLLSHVAEKNNPLLFKYIVETIYNEGLNPELLGEPICNIFNVIINARNVQNEPLDCSELLRTVLSLKNRNNQQMFNINDTDNQGMTLLHKVLIKMGSEQQLGMKYFKICLEFNPDFTHKTLRDSRTYMHHAILWGVSPEILDDILNVCLSQQIFILEEVDIENKRPCDLLSILPPFSAKAILSVLQKYDMMYLGLPWDPNLNTTRDDNEMSDLFNNGLLDDEFQDP